MDSFFYASFLLAVRRRQKNVFAVSLMQSTQSAQCSLAVGFSGNMSNLGFGVSLLQAVCGRLQVPSSVKRIPPDTAIHEQNGYAKVYNLIETNVDNDNSDMTYTNMRNK